MICHCLIEKMRKDLKDFKNRTIKLVQDEIVQYVQEMITEFDVSTICDNCEECRKANEGRRDIIGKINNSKQEP